MKRSCFAAFVLCLLSGSVFAATVATWVGPTGLWSDGSKWSTGLVPPVGSPSGDEIKITNLNTVCTVNSDVGVYSCRLGVAAGSTVEFVFGGVMSMGEARFGDANATGNGSIGYGNQTGGTLTVKDLILGRYTSTVNRETGQGHFRISGGTLNFISTETGRIYVGAGVNGGYNEGTFTVTGTGGIIQMKALYVGGNLTNFGKGTVAFEIAANGVSPIQLSDRYYLDPAGVNSVANLVLSASANPPAATIVLVNVTSSQTNSGVFDSMNGGSAAEGTEVILGDKIYKLTYQHAVGGGAANDIALVYAAGVNDRAHSPVPASGAKVETDLAFLSWRIPEPNTPGTPIYCDVYLGTEPNRPSMNKISLSAGVSSVAINKTNFPTYGALANKTLYYWAVDCYDPSRGPAPIRGSMWNFYTDNNLPPVVNAGADQVVWLGKSGTAGQETVTLYGATSDDDLPGPYSVLWTQVANDAPAVVISPNNVDVTSVTLKARGVYEFKLTANDGDKQAFATVKITVGTTACDASHLSTGAAYPAADVNEDCIVDMADFAKLIAENWLTCTDTLTYCGR